MSVITCTNAYTLQYLWVYNIYTYNINTNKKVYWYIFYDCLWGYYT